MQNVHEKRNYVPAGYRNGDMNMEKTEAIIREGKRALLSLGHGVQATAEWNHVSGLLEHYDVDVITNKAPGEVRSVLFLLTRMVRFAGGQTSILRIGTELVKQGVQVGYGVYKTQSKEEMALCAASNLEGYQGELYTKQDIVRMIKNPEEQPDVVIASSWDTVHYVKKFSSYRMYFVQDFEPYFYPFGDKFLMAKKTYEQGLHMVSLGDWNKKEIEKHCNPVSPIDCVEFPCELSEYPHVERDYGAYAEKKTLVMAVYLKYYGKRLPNTIQYMLGKVKETFAQRDGITLDIRYFGEAKSFVPKYGTNVGMLNKEELRQLYAEADFGMVASLSNISLIPYEMLATGLPLIEFEDGTFSEFFPENCALLTSLSWKDLYRQMKNCLEEPVRLQLYDSNATDYLATLSWEKSGRQFFEILSEIQAGTE